jgi:hypothetical protein
MMKKLLLFCLFSLLLASVCYAGPFDREEFDNVGYANSVTKTSDAAISSGPCYVYAVTCYSTSSNGYVNLYNSTDGSGSVVIEVAEATSGDSQRVEFAKPIQFDTACYVDVTSSVAVVEYRQ